jgi:hypothetical protein
MNTVWAATVYLLCLATSIACGFLLVRSYVQNRTRLLLWTAACFVLLAFNNLFLVIDTIVIPQSDLTFPRSLSALAAAAILIYGFIWEVD